MAQKIESVAAVPLIDPPGMALPDLNAKVHEQLQVSFREDGTLSVVIRGPRGAVKGWVEISADAADVLGRFLLDEEDFLYETD